MDKQVYKQVSQRANGSCEVCGRVGRLELHHILRRRVKETQDNCIMLCWHCHRGTKGVHGKDGHELDIKLKKQAQDLYKQRGLEESAIRQLMGGRLY